MNKEKIVTVKGEDGFVVEKIIDFTSVTQAAVTDILSRPHNGRVEKRSMPMYGFDDTFVDIVDYILRITHLIWHDKEVELCMKYYSKNCNMRLVPDSNSSLVYSHWTRDVEALLLFVGS